MNRKFLMFLSILFASVLVASTAPSVYACDPPSNGTDWQYVWCLIQEGYPVPAMPPTTAAQTMPAGDDPTTAREVIDTWQSLDPGVRVWYKTSYSENFRLLEFWLETATPNTVSFAVYSPDQSQGLSPATKPIGRGTHSNSDPETLIRWKASYAKPGVWYVLVSNNTNTPVSYKMNHNQQYTPVKKCISYWEYLPTGEYVLWTDCGFYTGPKE